MRLLLVEDDPDLSNSLTVDLERAGFAVDAVRWMANKENF